MAPTDKFPDIAHNDRTGLFYDFVSPELAKAVAKLQPSSISRDDYHVSIMKEFMAAVKTRNVSKGIAGTVRSTIFKENMLARLLISPNEGQTADELEVSLQQSSKARLATVIQAACTYHVELAQKSEVLESSQT